VEARDLRSLQTNPLPGADIRPISGDRASVVFAVGGRVVVWIEGDTIAT